MTSNIKVHVLHTGSVIVDETLPFKYKSNMPFAWTGLFRSKKKQLHLPVSVYLIEHPKGLVLIDTGWHTINRNKPVKNLALKAQLPEGEAVHEQLKKLGYQPADIDYVILSHLRTGHADGLNHVAEANQILVSKEEWMAAQKDKVHYLPNGWKNINIETFTFKESGIGPTGKSFDLFDDGTIEFVHAPGHSAGQCATRIKAHKDKNSFLLLVSDIGYNRKSWEYGLLSGAIINKDEAINSLNWVKVQSNCPQCIETIANHDTAIKPQVITL
ncbi:MAG TPA: N-acyl homoserine lactonase family protein [Staphylococcus sp.]|nr:N-acyl homoserine lactonase family protein [Staphylococcus sp.]